MAAARSDIEMHSDSKRPSHYLLHLSFANDTAVQRERTTEQSDRGALSTRPASDPYSGTIPIHHMLLSPTSMS